ncbi:MAG: hypothetical protein M3Q23_11985 [Actinomycetota bacterium]|nr:hypothetical protein [Actinomycetota bacterium]
MSAGTSTTPAHRAKTELRCAIENLIDIAPADAHIHYELMQFAPSNNMFPRPATLPVDVGTTA